MCEGGQDGDDVTHVCEGGQDGDDGVLERLDTLRTPQRHADEEDGASHQLRLALRATVPASSSSATAAAEGAGNTLMRDVAHIT